MCNDMGGQLRLDGGSVIEWILNRAFMPACLVLEALMSHILKRLRTPGRLAARHEAMSPIEGAKIGFVLFGESGNLFEGTFRKPHAVRSDPESWGA